MNALKIVFFLAFVLMASTAGAQTFEGPFTFLWTNKPENRHRIMTSLAEVSFTDKNGKIWIVPKDTDIDGASIPPGLWSFAGSPFVGNYRRASVIHDHYCDIKTELTSDVHNMFYDAMIADGVGIIEANTKWAAVSTYSLVTGGCGKAEDNLTLLLAFEDFEGFVKSDELLKQLDAYRSGLGNNLTLAARVDAIKAIAQVENPKTFAALSEFRRIPSEPNYLALETAVQAEDPTKEELGQLVLLVNATVPEGSLVWPVE